MASQIDQSIKLVQRRVLFEHPMAQIIQDILEAGQRKFPYFYLVSPNDAVATVGLNADFQLSLTRQYRHPVGQIIYDLPAGRLEPGESPLDGARREFEEETGYFPRRVESLGSYNQFPGSMRAATHLFFASDLIPTEQNLDEGEILEVDWIPVNEVVRMVSSGEIIDGSLQLGVLLALQKGLLEYHPG